MNISSKQIDRVLQKLNATITESEHHIRAFINCEGRKVFPPVYFSKHTKVISTAFQRKLLMSLGLNESQFTEFYSCRMSSSLYFDLRGIGSGHGPPKDIIKQPGLIDRFGEPLSLDNALPASIISVGSAIGERLLIDVQKNFDALNGMNSREFELLVAEIMRNKGYDVTLTPMARDGGKDLIIRTENEFGNQMFLVECKKYDISNPVGVAVVRELYGVVEAERATGGLLVTTSTFTKGAKEFQKNNRYKMTLADYINLTSWLIDA